MDTLMMDTTFVAGWSVGVPLLIAAGVLAWAALTHHRDNYNPEGGGMDHESTEPTDDRPALPVGFFYDAEGRVSRKCYGCGQPVHAPCGDTPDSIYWLHGDTYLFACADETMPPDQPPLYDWAKDEGFLGGSDD